MTAHEVWDDAERLAVALDVHAAEESEAGAILPVLLNALDHLSRAELLVLRQRLDERLTG